jgi:hypothetical protein
MSRSDKEELLRKLRHFEVLKKEKILDDFVATPMQTKFFQSQKPIRLLTAGNGSGKSLSLLMELIWTHLKLHPYRDCTSINHSWFISVGYDKVEDYCQELKRWCPPSQMPDFDKMGTSSIRRLRWKNGDMTTFYSTDADPNRFEGTNFQKLFIDEPCPRAIYIAALRGLRNTPNWSVVWAMTPIAEPWIYEDLYLPSVSGLTSDIEIFEGSSYDNPHLSREFLKAFEAQLSEDERATRIDGKFALLQGRVFKEFKRKEHVLKFQDWPLDWPVYESFDVHTRKPNTAIWVGLTKDEELVVIDELAVEGIPAFAEAVIAKRGQRRIVSTIVDNSALSADWSTRSAMDMLSEAGIRATAVRQQDKDVANGINKIKRLLKGTPDDQGNHRPRLFVMENCRTMIKEFEMYVWDDHRVPERSGIKEKPRKIYDDFLDPLRYIVNRDPRFDISFTPVNYRPVGAYNRDYTRLKQSSVSGL